MGKGDAEYGADVEIDPKIMDDYDSEEFDIGDAADDYDANDLAQGVTGRKKKKGGSFLDPDEKLQDWDFGGLQMEKHSRSAHAANKKRKRNLREEDPKSESEPEPAEPEPAPEPEPAEPEPAPEPEEEEHGN